MIRAFVVLVAMCGLAHSQVRGVYPAGMNATHAGVLAEPGFGYSNLFLLYARDRLTGTNGEVVQRGHNSVLIDMNTFVWASEKAVLGARYSAAASLPLANNSLSSEIAGSISGGGGFADSYYQPAILGWRFEHLDVKVAYGFLAPTGRFDADANDNVGSGYWTHTLASGQTIYLARDKRTALSLFAMYEWHGTQEGTGIRPGDTFNVDYSLTHAFALRNDTRLQLGLIGYRQKQTSNKRGPGITPEQAAAHYKVDALGLGAHVTLPRQGVSLGFRYFEEFASRSTFEGYSVQILAAVKF
jgi:hypothetical protein